MAKRNNPADASSLMTLGLLAVGGYFVYEWLFATPATTAATTTTTGTAAAGTTAASASTAAGTTAASTTPAAATGSTLDGIYAAMLALIATDQDPNFTGTGSAMMGTPYHFNVYLQLVATGYTVPDPAVVFGSATQADSTMSAAAFWAKTAPAMQAANAGLSGMGLGLYGAAGACMAGLGRYRA